MGPPQLCRSVNDSDETEQQLAEQDDDDEMWRRFGKVDIERAGHGW